MNRWKRAAFLAIPSLVLGSGYLLSVGQQEEPAEAYRPPVTPTDCIFLQNPDEFLTDTEAIYTMRSNDTDKISEYRFPLSIPEASPVDPLTIPQKNLIDNSIFPRMAQAGIQSAPIASDTEFLRRVTLDLTGRIPSPAEVDAFAADTSASKRDAKIDALVGTPEFIDKWTMFLGDIVKNSSRATNVTRYTEGRDAFYLYLKDAVSTNKPYDQMVREMMTATGDSFAVGQTNWQIGTTVPMGPTQDTFDGAAVNTAAMFMGINTVDCLLCHDGPRHLDEVSLWGVGQTRQNMWGLSSYFSRVRFARQQISPIPNLLIKTILTENTTGAYQLNTTTGNRTARQPVNGATSISPRYPFGTSTNPGSGINTGETYRQGLARQITADIQFSRAAVNYVWEQFMVEAFVSPSNTFDLARLDPARPPAAPWTLQPTNPELLNSLATWFQQNRYDLRALIKLIAKSNAYQLSSVYPGTWNVAYVPYYARKFVRRLTAEEIHDGIIKAAGVPVSYPMTYLPAVSWAMQLPDTQEPLRLGAVTQFLTAFGRGDRDVTPRRSDGSVSQTLNLMNSSLVMTRIHQVNQGSTVATLLGQTQDAATIIRQLFLSTLSRPPTSAETALFTPSFQQQGTRVAAENLQWVLLNKLEFIFNY